jgi:ABC-type polysaccharide/polyol phosphate export permease
MEGTWLHPVAQINPMTQVLQLARQGFVTTGVRWEDTWPGLLTIAGATVLMAIWALRGLRRVAP